MTTAAGTGKRSRLSAAVAQLGAATVLAWARVAAGHEVDSETVPAERAGVGEHPREGASEGSRGEATEEVERKFSLGLDLALGWGKAPFAVQNLPTTGMQAITYSLGSATPSVVESFLLAGTWEVREGVELGARVPFSFGTFSPAGSETRSATSFGNVELEAEASAHLGERVQLAGRLGVDLPTAQGDEIPDDLSGALASTVDPNSFDRYSVARAAALARGYEDNSLFEPKRLGIVPKVALAFRGGAWAIEPYVKVENLFATSSALDSQYVGELVPGLKVGYRIGPSFELALRAWATVGFAGAEEDRKTSGALEPRVSVGAGGFRAFAGFVVPLAGPPADAGFLALRLGVTVAF